MHYLDDSHIFLFLVQLFILISSARGLGELFRRYKQPALTAEIIVGVVLGPTILGRFLPQVQRTLFPSDIIQQSMLETIGWLGVLFLLLETGLEIDFSIAWRQRGNSFIIALSDIVIPMIVAFAAVVFLPARYMVDPKQRILFSLFMATVMTISAMPVTARVFHDLRLLKTDLGLLVMSALAVNDVIGWVLFTIILSLFSQGTIAVSKLLLVFIITTGFAAMALTIGRKLSIRVFDVIKARNLPEPATSLTVTVILALFCGAVTQQLGIHALFGFFIAGVVAGEAKGLSEQTRSIISQLVHSLFVPLFFANIGLKIDFVENFDVFLVLLMCVVGIVGRYLGAWVGVKLSSVPQINSNLISIAHTPGGMMEIVVALLAIEAGIITPQVFVAIVFSAVLSSVTIGPWMAWALSRRAAVSAAQFLEPKAIVAELNASSRDEAINILSEVIANGCGCSKNLIAEKAVARERELSTAIGAAVAIPHVRLKDIKKPLLAFGRSLSGIEWDAPDGEPVHLIFFLAIPEATPDIHVQILASISSAMADQRTRKLICDTKDSLSLFQILKTSLIKK